jgi:DNA-binding transcriptional LysR family regulator
VKNVTLRQLRSLAAIAVHGRIGTAAEALGLTSPAVTLQLKQMEDEAGVALIERAQDGAHLTPAGAIVLRAAHAIAEELRVMDEQLSALKGGRRGTIRLGAVSTAKYFTPRLIAGFRADNPEIHIDLLVGNRREIVEALRHRRVDVALMGRPPRDVDVRAQVFGEHPLVIVAPPGHRLTQVRHVAKEDLVGEHFLLREAGSGTRSALEMFLADVPSMPDSLGTEMGSNETVKQAVMAGLGIAFISAHTIEQELRLGRLVILDVEGMPIRRQWFMVSRRSRAPTPVLDRFSTFLFERGANFLPSVELAR